MIWGRQAGIRTDGEDLGLGGGCGMVMRWLFSPPLSGGEGRDKRLDPRARAWRRYDGVRLEQAGSSR